jgi:hypothetical protein
MSVFEVKYNNGEWCLRQNGASSYAHIEPTRGRIGAYVEGYMSNRSGRVVFYLENGSVEREAYYEARDFQWWGQPKVA